MAKSSGFGQNLAGVVLGSVVVVYPETNKSSTFRQSNF